MLIIYLFVFCSSKRLSICKLASTYERFDVGLHDTTTRVLIHSGDRILYYSIDIDRQFLKIWPSLYKKRSIQLIRNKLEERIDELLDEFFTNGNRTMHGFQAF